VANLLDNTIYGVPVGMHVEWAHEDGDHQSAVVEVVRLLHLLDNHNLTIGRSYNDTVCFFAREASRRTTEEIDQQCVYGSGKYGKEDKQDTLLRIGQIIYKSIG
jgi:hypothetical protein